MEGSFDIIVCIIKFIDLCKLVYLLKYVVFTKQGWM